MSECRHEPPCATPAAHRDTQRDDWQRQLNAREAAARNQRGRRQARAVLPRGYRLAGAARRPAAGSGP